MAESSSAKGPRRVGTVIYLQPDRVDEYKRIHAAVWPEVLEQIKGSNIEDYSIYLMDEPRPMLFASFKYVGDDWDADMQRMAANPKVREWWKITDSMQQSLVPGAVGSAKGPGWWKPLEEVFYTA